MSAPLWLRPDGGRATVDRPPTYKHAISVTGQVFFCAAPIRLDAYDGCQFGCVYCFSRRRARIFAQSGVHAANTVSFAQRLARVRAGVLASSLDEFLAVRTPLQLGGLNDPFTPREAVYGVTLALMKTLRLHQYPTLISTKGSLVAEPQYLDVLREMNVVVRFSAAGVDERSRPQIDRRCGSFDETLARIELLTAAGIATGLRIQPVLPGFETEALAMTRRAASAGVRQVSFEYLKVASETARSDARLVRAATGVDVFGIMQARGMTRVGWDYTLPPVAKRPFVIEARRLCHSLCVRFGAGDTEFIPWSDGDGCCGSDNALLRGAKQFGSNLVGVIKSAVQSERARLSFSDIGRRWTPRLPVSTYLNPRSRGGAGENGRSDWFGLLAHRWNGSAGPYTPDFFDGVEWTGKVDRHGFRIYNTSQLAAALRD